MMKRLSPKPLRFFMTVALLTGGSLWLNAQHHHDDDTTCSIIRPTGEDSVRYARLLQSAPKAVSNLRGADVTAQVEVPIHNSGEVYQFRVALLITPEVLDEFNGGDEATVMAWWDKAEAELNGYYRNDVGIEIKVVKDSRLIMFENNTGYDIRNGSGSLVSENGTPIVNSLIGEESYDLGLMITKGTGSLAGQASLGGASSRYRKACGFAVSRITTIAHEMGHLFGAEHTHYIADGDYTEPGSGRSIMSYGSPRDFFSLGSIRYMRRLLRALNVYTTPERTPEAADYSHNSDIEGTNMPYAYRESGVQPQIDDDLLAKEYVVTEGSNFQFHIPLKSPIDEPLLYAVHGLDIALPMGANALQPVYKPTASSAQMFQPYYENPTLVAADAQSLYIPFSDASRTGLFTFAAAVHQKSLYDSRKIRLLIIKGEPFSAGITSPTNSQLYRWGSKLSVSWTPQTDVYGPNSRVRISLSTDFGQSFPYILADDLPNTGTWTGAFPYITIGQTAYHDYPQAINGGTLKVEIIGEAPYAMMPNMPYYRQNGETIYSGGFTLNASNARYFFKDSATGGEPPAPYVCLESIDDLPATAPTLVAYYKTNTSTTYNTTYAQTAEGRLIRRTWTATISGTPYVYTQIFELPEQKSATAAINKQLKDIGREAAELVSHEGEPGYPLPSLAAYRELKDAYPQVFDSEGFLLPDFDTAAGERVLAAVQTLHNATDDEIVYPKSGRYLLRSYQALPAGTPYFYYRRTVVDTELKEVWKADAADGTPLLLTAGPNGIYLKDDEGNVPYLDGMTNTYNDFILRRGYTWGSFTLLSHNLQQAQLSRSGETFSLNHRYADDPQGYLCNNNDVLIVSTDFQFVPIVKTASLTDETFYRLRSCATGHYLTLPENLETNTSLRLSATPDAGNIWMKDGNHLLAYASGYYMNGTTHGALDQAAEYQFEAHPTVPGAYAVKWNESYLQVQDGVPATTSSASDETTAWQVVPTALLPVDVSASGYSTLFAPQTLAAQDETTIYAATLDQTAGRFKLTSTDGIVPAGQGVVIKATEGRHWFGISQAASTVTSDLTGSLATTRAVPAVFTLQNGSDGVCFYRYATDGAGSVDGLLLKGFKAYWQGPADTSASSYRLDFDHVVDGTPTVVFERKTTDTPLYDLTGRRINRPTRGICISGGKKCIVQ